jgi:hypothetical protein
VVWKRIEIDGVEYLSLSEEDVSSITSALP